MFGARVIEVLRRSGCRTPVIMITGYGSEDVAFQCGRVGADLYLTKPVRARDLLPVLREWAQSPGQMPVATRAMSPPPPMDFARHNSDRLASAVVNAMALARDPRTFADWARVPGATEDGLHQLCTLLGLDGRDALTFTRLLRAVALVELQGATFADVLDVAVEKTLTTLVAKSGFSAGDTASVVTRSRFLTQQRLLTQPAVLHRICELLGCLR